MSDPQRLTETLVGLQWPAPARLAQYALQRQVGAGTMGVVYQAHDVDLERPVAIKLLHPGAAAGSDAEQADRLLREARNAARLSHPNVARIYQVGWQDARPFIAMEWLDGTDLSEWVHQHGAMPWPDALMAVGDAASALVAAHQAGLVHRDIKPSNLMRLRSGQVKVVDFGLARRVELDPQLTAPGAIVGTPAYLSPEQCQGGEATPSSDLYALGCTLIHLLSGAAPFAAGNALDNLHKHVYEPMPELGQRVPGLPPTLLQLVRRATAKRPAERHASAAELLAELHAVLDGHGITASGHGIALRSHPMAEAIALQSTGLPLQVPPALRDSGTGEAPGNLPQELGAFIGRQALLNQAWADFGKTRLLSLVGTGGTGKTRLALRLARLAAAQFTDGAWWVDLAPLRAGQSADAALAQARSIRDSDGQDLPTAVVEFFRRRQALIVFDNCEHVLESTAALAARLLATAPGVQLVATSRQALAVPGEVLLAVPPMQVCPADAPRAAQLDNEAVQLFAHRALALRSSFVLDAPNTAAVAEICRRLDGIPLAIELAAARIKVLMPAQIAARLDDLFRLLIGGQRTLLPRQQTLRALIDWSHELLQPAQQRLLAGLAVFQGDFSLAAAEQVLADATWPARKVLDGLGELVDQSLVVAAEHDGQMHFRLLHTIRHYAFERLRERGDLDVLQQRHADHYARAMSEQAARLDGSGVAAAKSAMATMLDNARAAFEASLLQNWPALALQLATALARHDLHRGILGEGVLRTERLLATEPPPSAELALLLEGAGSLALRLARWDLARSWFERGLAIADNLQDERQRGQLLRSLGNLAYRAEDYPLAVLRYEQALAAARSAGHRAAEAHALGNLAAVKIEQAQPAQARDFLLQALRIYQDAGNLRAEASLLGNLGIIDHDLGAFDLSRQHFHDSIARHEAIADRRGAAIARCQFGACLIAAGDHAAAQGVVEPAVETLRQLDDPPTLAAALDWLARALFHQRQPVPAKALAQESLALRRAAANQNDVADSLDLFAELLAAESPERAAALLGAAAAWRERLGITLQARDRADVDVVASACRRALGERRFTACVAAGRLDALDAALDGL